MHIADGFLSTPVWIIAYIIAILFIALAIKWSKENLDEKYTPLLAVLAAGIFAIMSFNLPVPFGSSGHLLGAALVAIIFCSPYAAILVLAIVLIIQALFFGDGGITALGANILNMGVVGGFVPEGYLIGFGATQLGCNFDRQHISAERSSHTLQSVSQYGLDGG